MNELLLPQNAGHVILAHVARMEAALEELGKNPEIACDQAFLSHRASVAQLRCLAQRMVDEEICFC